LLLGWGPSFFSYGFERLYVPWSTDPAGMPLYIQVEPGDVEITQGGDQEISARLMGFHSADVRMNMQPEGSTIWKPAAMDRGPEEGRFLYLLVDIQSSLSYYVEAGGIRSPSHRITVLPLARVEQIDATYDFPAYSGMKSQTVENEGDISALRGTRVSLRVRLSKPVASARLLLDDQSTIPLAGAGDKLFGGSLEVQRSGSYVVQLADSDGRLYAGSREYDLEAIDDAPPRVVITRPMRDVRATSVEEVFSEISAEDDIGVAKVRLFYSVNGTEEKTVELFQAAPPERAVVSAHTFFLEEFGLQPGDLVSYYARATDNNNVTGPGDASSDIYFIQIRPFENQFTQSQQGAMPQGGGGQGGNDSLSRQQKEIIAGTFRLVRDKGIMDPKEYEEGLNALALVQSRLQAQAQSVVDRLLRRGATDVSDEFSRLAQYLRGAIEEMQKAAVDLGAAKPAEALPAEQKALQQLLRAESLFLEIQISFGNQGGGGGGGGQAADAEDLTDLFELELNKLKNQYETVQRGETRQRDQELDEAAERLKELAQRQQQLNERMRNLGQRPGASSTASGAGSESQRRLMDEAEDLARRLQRLSRERNSPELNRVGNQLQQAIQEMRKSLQNRQAGQDAVPQGVRALERLDEAGSALNRERNVGLGRGLENAIDTARELEKEQERVQADVDDMIRAREGAGRERMEQMGQEVATRKSLMAERLQNLSGTIQDLAREARKDQPETSARLNEAAGTIRERRLPERILSGNRMLEGGYLDSLKGREEYIRSALNDVSRRLEEARNSIGQTREGNLEDALTRTRRLAEGLESLQRRLQRGGESGDRGTTEPGQQAGAQPRPDPSGRQSGEAGRQARKQGEQAG
ncbi:MAG: hypothetical protein ABIG68_02410, partial [Acidobacteriota bacterium]